MELSIQTKQPFKQHELKIKKFGWPVKMVNKLALLKNNTEIHFLWKRTKIILSSKSDNVLSTFYSQQLDQQLVLYQNLRGLWHST